MEDIRDHIIITPHHPDRLHWMPVRTGAAGNGRFEQTFTWNVFRTLELLPPAFWLRPLHARLGAQTFPAAPQMVRVHLWKPLALPRAQRIDGARGDIVVDVTIDTEHAVWTLMLAGDRDRRLLDGDSDLIVMGAQGRGGMELALFGSTTQQVVRSATS